MKRFASVFSMILLSASARASITTLKFQGQKLSSTDVQTYHEFQLKADDVIISFDDTPLSSPKDAMDLYNKIRAGQLSKMLVERGGQYLMLTKSVK